MLSILKSALSEGTGKVTLFYANRDEKSVIFGKALRELTSLYPDRLSIVHWLESVQGLPNPTILATQLAPYTTRETFICGPAPSWPPPKRRCSSPAPTGTMSTRGVPVTGLRPVRRRRARRR